MDEFTEAYNEIANSLMTFHPYESVGGREARELARHLSKMLARHMVKCAEVERLEFELQIHRSRNNMPLVASEESD